MRGGKRVPGSVVVEITSVPPGSAVAALLERSEHAAVQRVSKTAAAFLMADKASDAICTRHP
jgi:hypothetical protein